MKPTNTNFRCLIDFLLGVLIVCVIGFLLVLGLQNGAFAAEIDQGKCRNMAVDAQSIARERDAGMAEEDAVVGAYDGLREFVGGDNSYLLSEEDLAFMMALVHQIYLHPDITPDDIAVRLYNSCVEYGFGHRRLA